MAKEKDSKEAKPKQDKAAAQRAQPVASTGGSIDLF